MPNDLRTWFPKLDARNHRITSREDPGYNCVAWATCDSTRWWDHVCGYWPDGVTQDSSVEAYVDLFRELGFEESANSEPEPVARLLESGNWTSKLGVLEDIEHDDLDSLADGSYGRPFMFLRRARKTR